MTDDTKVDELKLAPLPLQFGLIVYPQFEVLDVFGPLEALNVVGRKEFGPKNVDISLVIIAETLEPVSSMAKCSKIDQRILPTHTFETAAKLELDVLLVPGGLGSDAPNKAAIKFIADRFGSLQYLITVCTGADLAARAGVLDGLCATTNKAAWNSVTSKTTSHKTYWVAKARWVANRKVWTSSGVSAGTDAVIAWMSQVYGEDVAAKTCIWMEYNRETDPSNDPFAAIYDCKDVPFISV